MRNRPGGVRNAGRRRNTSAPANSCPRSLSLRPIGCDGLLPIARTDPHHALGGLNDGQGAGIDVVRQNAYAVALWARSSAMPRLPIGAAEQWPAPRSPWPGDGR